MSAEMWLENVESIGIKMSDDNTYKEDRQTDIKLFNVLLIIWTSFTLLKLKLYIYIYILPISASNNKKKHI